MGTRSLTVVLDEDSREICVLYRQYDGYPAGHGFDLKHFLSGFQIVNGLGVNKQTKIANGMGCLAAQLITFFKAEAGGFYLYPAGTRDCGEEYVYTIYLSPQTKNGLKRLHLKIQAGAITFFGLPGTKQANMPIIYEGTVDGFDPENIQETWSNRDVEPVHDFIDDQVLSANTLDIPEVAKPDHSREPKRK